MGRRNQVLASGGGDGSQTAVSSFSLSSMSASLSSSAAVADKNLKADFLDEDPLSLLPETKAEDHDEVHHQKTAATKDHHEDKPYEVQLVWRNIFALGILHLITLYTLTMVPSMHYTTIFWAYAVIILGSMGVQSGAHRYDKK